jgi:ABC-2 type transport system ATP-binding protein
VHNIRVDGARAHFTVDAGAINRVMEYITPFDVRALTSAPPTLEDLFLHHYELQTGESAR